MGTAVKPAQLTVLAAVVTAVGEAVYPDHVGVGAGRVTTRLWLDGLGPGESRSLSERSHVAIIHTSRNIWSWSGLGDGSAWDVELVCGIINDGVASRGLVEFGLAPAVDAAVGSRLVGRNVEGELRLLRLLRGIVLAELDGSNDWLGTASPEYDGHDDGGVDTGVILDGEEEKWLL